MTVVLTNLLLDAEILFIFIIYELTVKLRKKIKLTENFKKLQNEKKMFHFISFETKSL